MGKRDGRGLRAPRDGPGRAGPTALLERTGRRQRASSGCLDLGGGSWAGIAAGTRARAGGAPAGRRVTRSSPFPLSLPVADAAAPAAPWAEDWTAEPRAAAAAAAPPSHPPPSPGCLDLPAWGREAGQDQPGSFPGSSSHLSARLLLPHSPPPGPEPRAPRLGTGRGGGRATAPPRPLLLGPLERFVKLPIPPAARSSSSSSSASSSEDPKATIWHQLLSCNGTGSHRPLAVLCPVKQIGLTGR